MDKQQLLAEIRSARERLERTLARVPDARMAEPANGEWTGKDLVAHLEGWEDRTVRLWAIIHGQREFDPDEPGETDAFNAWWYERNAGRSLEDVRASERRAWQAVVDLVEAADEAELTDPERFEFLEGGTFDRIVRENTSEHYADHVEQLEPLAR